MLGIREPQESVSPTQYWDFKCVPLCLALFLFYYCYYYYYLIWVPEIVYKNVHFTDWSISQPQSQSVLNAHP